jgi:hypothetical protein
MMNSLSVLPKVDPNNRPWTLCSKLVIVLFYKFGLVIMSVDLVLFHHWFCHGSIVDQIIVDLLM